MKNNLKGNIYLFFGYMLAGTSVITGYLLIDKLSNFLITAISLGIVLLCLAPFYALKTLHAIKLLKWRDWIMLLLQALFGIFLFRTFLLFGLKFTSTVEAGILTGTTPAITSVLAFFVLREKLTVNNAFGIGCTVIGIVLLQGANLFSINFSLHHIGGNLLILCAAASESTFIIISRRYRVKKPFESKTQMHPMVQTLIVSSIAFVLSLIPALFTHPLTTLRLIGFKEWLALVWYGIFVTALAFVFFYEGIKYCNAYMTAAFSGMIPLTSMFLSLFLLHEAIISIQWIGGFLIIISMIMIGLSGTLKQKNKGCD